MSELVALSFDTDASPSVRFEAPSPSDLTANRRKSAALYGWGVGWYPSSDRGASVIKDPTSSGERTVSDAIGDWHRFRSTTFICHLRGHQRPRKQEDAQPFVRSYGGRQWIFAHDGDLASDWRDRFALPDDPAFDPLGRTDSEHAFCLLLSRLHAQKTRSLAAVDPLQLRSWLESMNAGGQLNVVLSDGEHLAVYHDAVGVGQLHWTRRTPPHPPGDLTSSAIRIAMDSPEDPNRTQLIFSSVPLSEEGWSPIAPGQLIIARRGSVVWSSGPLEQAHRSVVPSGPSTSVATPGQVEVGQQVSAAQPLPSLTEPALPNGATASRVLRICHETRYQYSEAVDRSAHRILLRPVEDRAQELLQHSLDIQLSVDSVEYEDVFGNASLGVEIVGPYDDLSITCQSVVRVDAAPPLEHRTVQGRHTIPLAWMPWQRQMLTAYLMPPELPETQLQELSQFAMSFVDRNDYDLVGTLLDVNKTIYRDFEYVSGSTTNETTAFQVFESRRGVCQDFANLMICLARLLHVPARYRMGYIFTGADYVNQIQSEASHAWVELYIPRVGWHGFDPTNGIQVGADHVRVACGRNYLDATPITGTIYRGGGTETMTVTVRVEETDEIT
jgi:predicted glutamine amidotransferase